MNASPRILLIVAATLTAVVLAPRFLGKRQEPPRDAPLPAPLSSPTRAQSMALAEQYVTHQWSADISNVFHGQDPAGISVNTLDAAHKGDNGIDAGWWLIGATNIGLPYKWGGFDTPETFDAGLRAGKFAGDAYTAEKRRLLDDAVSDSAIGIDCSGFISRCWQLPRSYSTRELPALCDPLPDPSRWLPGDILNTHNSHVRLFAGWENQAAGRAIFYEASARVQRQVSAIDDMFREGYQAWRYRGMRDE